VHRAGEVESGRHLHFLAPLPTSRKLAGSLCTGKSSVCYLAGGGTGRRRDHAGQGGGATTRDREAAREAKNEGEGEGCATVQIPDRLGHEGGATAQRRGRPEAVRRAAARRRGSRE
jgi:hypothetical protein